MAINFKDNLNLNISYIRDSLKNRLGKDFERIVSVSLIEMSVDELRVIYDSYEKRKMIFDSYKKRNSHTIFDSRAYQLNRMLINANIPCLAYKIVYMDEKNQSQRVFGNVFLNSVDTIVEKVVLHF